MMSANRLAFAVAVCCLFGLVGCEENTTPNDEQKSVSPIVNFDKERLWILLRFAGKNIRSMMPNELNNCGLYFNSPTDPRYVGQAQSCEGWTRDASEFLALNGLPDVKPEHLKESVFWEWYGTRYEPMIECQDNKPKFMEKGWKDAPACDPYEETLAGLGADRRQIIPPKKLAESLEIVIPPNQKVSR